MHIIPSSRTSLFKEIIVKDITFVSTDCLCIMSPVEFVTMTSINPKLDENSNDKSLLLSSIQTRMGYWGWLDLKLFPHCPDSGTFLLAKPGNINVSANPIHHNLFLTIIDCLK